MPSVAWKSIRPVLGGEEVKAYLDIGELSPVRFGGCPIHIAQPGRDVHAWSSCWGSFFDSSGRVGVDKAKGSCDDGC